VFGGQQARLSWGAGARWLAFILLALLHPFWAAHSLTKPSLTQRPPLGVVTVTLKKPLPSGSIW
jgi:hypothetical protein